MINALMERAVGLHSEGRLAEAEQLYEQALALSPGLSNARHMLGVLRAQQGRNQEALDLIAPVVTANPNDVVALANLGNTLDALQRRDEALAYLDRAIALAPDYPDAWCNRGNVLLGLGRAEEALKSYEKAIGLKPDFPLALNNHGNALVKLRQYEAAIGSYDYAIAQSGDIPEVHVNRAHALQRLCRFSEALMAYDRVLSLSPDNAGAWNDRGVVLQQLGKFDAALHSFMRAQKIAPEMPEARFNQGRLFLLQQDFRRGWPLFEARKEMPVPLDARSFPQPLWTGSEDLNGKTLFAHIRCGLGDAMQFCRYAWLARERGASVILSVNDPLLPLLSNATPPLTLIGDGQVPERFDYHIPLLSLPMALGIDISPMTRYLAADPVRASQWRERIGRDGYRIAIAWQGDTAEGAEGKSFPVSSLSRIAAMPGVRLISLQKNVGSEQLQQLPPGMTVESFAQLDDGGAFLDSAAIIENCDLVISCDTAIAHLAGALGVANWLALQFVPDWRWFLERGDTPWYRNTRLFRQESPGDWSSVFQAMEGEMAACLK